MQQSLELSVLDYWSTIDDTISDLLFVEILDILPFENPLNVFSRSGVSGRQYGCVFQLTPFSLQACMGTLGFFEKVVQWQFAYQVDLLGNDDGVSSCTLVLPMPVALLARENK